MNKDKHNITSHFLAEQTALRDKDVLEIGCGQGRMTHPMCDLALTLTALDPDPEAVRSVARSLEKRIDLHCLPAESLPFPAACFDTIVFSQSLHHVTDIARAFAEARRLLRPGGAIIVIEPAPDSELMRIFRIFDEEEEARLLRVRSFLQNLRRCLCKKVVFEPLWEFADSEELLAWGETFVPIDFLRRQAVLTALGPKVADRPLQLKDSLTLMSLQVVKVSDKAREEGTKPVSANCQKIIKGR